MSPTEILTQEILSTPTGELRLLTDAQDRLCYAGWETARHGMDRVLASRGAVEIRRRLRPSTAARAFAAYFEGEVGALDAVCIDAAGTPFQRQVWAALRDIPAGETRSYKALAAAVGRAAAVRAVGLANGANPVAIVAPCHRVIGADGSLTGYGGGLERKRWLLEHERSALARRAAA